MLHVKSFQIFDRKQYENDPKPLAKEMWAGAVDTVGGKVKQINNSIFCKGFMTELIYTVLKGCVIIGVKLYYLFFVSDELWEALGSTCKNESDAIDQW